MNKVLYWLPRVLAILFILFISLFAFDVFGHSNWFFALLIHLIPSFVTLLVTIIAWKFEKIGGCLFLLLSVAGIWFYLPKQATSLMFVIPLMIIGILFLVNGFIKMKR